MSKDPGIVAGARGNVPLLFTMELFTMELFAMELFAMELSPWNDSFLFTLPTLSSFLPSASSFLLPHASDSDLTTWTPSALKRIFPLNKSA